MGGLKPERAFASEGWGGQRRLVAASVVPLVAALSGRLFVFGRQLF